MARPGNANQWTPAQAREMGKKGGRPKGSITKAYRTVYELAKRILTDPDVQDQMLQQARAGTLHPSTMRDLMYIYGGRPAYKMDVPRVSDPDDEAKRAAIKAMPKEKRRLMMDLIREANVLAEQAKHATSGSGPARGMNQIARCSERPSAR